MKKLIKILGATSAILGALLINEFNSAQEQNSPFQPLHFAVQRNDLDKINLLISKGADINAKNKYGMTALHYAVLWNRKEIFDILSSKGADINAKDKNGMTPLHHAARYNNPNFG